MPVTIVAKLKAKPGSEGALEQELRAMVEKVRGEEGALQYVLHRAAKDPGTFVFYERYRDREAVDHHMKTPHMAELQKKLGTLLEGSPDIMFLEELAAKR